MRIPGLSTLIALLAATASSPAVEPPLILACEQSEHRLVMLDPEADWAEASAVVWEWRADRDPGVAAEHRRWFRHPSDAKGGDGSELLTVASGGGVAVIDRRSGGVTAYGRAGSNPHSVVRLPGGYLLTASSTDNLLRLFPPPAGKRLEGVQDLELQDAHGLVWDAGRDCVWALGGKRMKRLAFERGEKRLEVSATIELPVTERSRRHERHGGHDLVWDAAGKRLLLSDMDDLWSFDPETGGFALLRKGPVAHVKSLSPPLRKGDPLLVMQASEQWWSDRVRSLDGAWSRRMPGARFYKARWVPGGSAGGE